MNASENVLNGFYGYIIAHKGKDEARRFIQDNVRVIADVALNMSKEISGVDKAFGKYKRRAMSDDDKKSVIQFLDLLAMKFREDVDRILELEKFVIGCDTIADEVLGLDFRFCRLLHTIGESVSRDYCKLLQRKAAVDECREISSRGESLKGSVKGKVMNKIKLLPIIDGVEIPRGAGYPVDDRYNVSFRRQLDRDLKDQGIE